MERSTVNAAPRLDLSGMALFVSIVEEGSLSAAGRVLGLPKATVSRRLAQLERQAGAPLVARSTRSLTLTDAGRRHYERIRGLVHEAEAAQAELVAGNAEPSGLMRVSVSATYGRLVLAPRILAFAARHPRLRIELELSDERVNVIADRYDLVVRMGAIEDSELIGRRLADMPVVLVASPGYCAQAGTPATPAELARHDAVVMPPWLDHWQVGDEAVRVRWRLSTTSLAAARLAALAGLGIARLPAFVVADDLASAALSRILPDAALPRSPATALYPRAAIPSVALRLLLDELQSLPAPQSQAGSNQRSASPS